MCLLDFNVDILPVKQPHQKQPKQDKCDRISERGIDRLRPGKKERLEDPLLHRDLFPVCNRDPHHPEQPCHDSGEDEQCEGVDTKNDERLGPPLHLFDVDESVARGESKQC